MAYHIYQTEAFVLNERVSGEANKIFYLLTPDLGLVVAVAQGVRLLKSKLRYQIRRYELVHVSLVRGKEVWRLVGAEKSGELDGVLNDPAKFESVAKIFVLLARFLQGEGEQTDIFNDLKAGIIYLATDDRPEIRRGFELAMALRILSSLGYVKTSSEVLPVLTFKVWSAEVLKIALGLENTISLAVDSAAHASHI